jgi:hypothetical protein
MCSCIIIIENVTYHLNKNDYHLSSKCFSPSLNNVNKYQRIVYHLKKVFILCKKTYLKSYQCLSLA